MQKPVQVCKMAAVEGTVRVPHVVEKRIPVTYTYSVPHVVCYREPIGPCGEPLGVIAPEAGVSAPAATVTTPSSEPTATFKPQTPTPAPPKKDNANGASSADKAPELGIEPAAPKSSDTEKLDLVPVPSKDLLK